MLPALIGFSLLIFVSLELKVEIVVLIYIILFGFLSFFMIGQTSYIYCIKQVKKEIRSNQ